MQHYIVGPQLHRTTVATAATTDAKNYGNTVANREAKRSVVVDNDIDFSGKPNHYGALRSWPKNYGNYMGYGPTTAKPTMRSTWQKIAKAVPGGSMVANRGKRKITQSKKALATLPESEEGTATDSLDDSENKELLDTSDSEYSE
ncbi:hypothetical protein K438DRAFT_1748437 [Mycena galopus ATCC 62051]|nr:hypothetical protein K438DRAFT_1748437 [Mycena galopus ATCC 62051]